MRDRPRSRQFVWSVAKILCERIGAVLGGAIEACSREQLDDATSTDLRNQICRTVPQNTPTDRERISHFSTSHGNPRPIQYVFYILKALLYSRLWSKFLEWEALPISTSGRPAFWLTSNQCPRLMLTWPFNLRCLSPR